MRLLHKSLILFLSAALLPLLLAGGLLLAEMESSLRASSLALQWSAADGAAESVRRALDGSRDVLEVVAGAAFSSSRRPAAVDEAFKTVLDNHPQFMDVQLLSEDGRVRRRLGRFRGGGEALFQDWPAARAAADALGFTSGNLRVREGAYPLLSVCLSARGYPDPAYLCARVNLLDLNAHLKGLDLGSGGRAALIDLSGRVVAASSDSTPPGRVWPVREVLSPDWKEGDYAASDGVHVLGVKAPVPGVGWLLYERPTAEAFRLFRAARRRILAGLLAAVTLAVFLCAVVTRFLGRFLRTFREAVRGMKEGRFDAALPSGGADDELGSVARELGEARGVIERQVRQAVIGMVAHRVGHDMRQPLTAVRNSLDVVRRHVTGADAVAEKHLSLIEEELSRAGDYIEEILSLGREKPLSLRRLDMGGLVGETVARTAFRPGVSVEASLPEAPVFCLADGEGVRRALTNLLGNAQEAIDRDGRVAVAVSRADGEVSVSVSDTGGGIPAGVRERMFEDFFTTKPQGTGLGMGIVKRIVERHGGRLTVDSADGRGTTIVFTLPAAR